MVYAIYVLLNLAGTLASMKTGHHGKTFIKTLRHFSTKRQFAEVGLCLCVGAFIWLPTLPVRMYKTMRA